MRFVYVKRDRAARINYGAEIAANTPLHPHRKLILNKCNPLICGENLRTPYTHEQIAPLGLPVAVEKKVVTTLDFLTIPAYLLEKS